MAMLQMMKLSLVEVGDIPEENEKCWQGCGKVGTLILCWWENSLAASQ